MIQNCINANLRQRCRNARKLENKTRVKRNCKNPFYEIRVMEFTDKPEYAKVISIYDIILFFLWK